MKQQIEAMSLNTVRAAQKIGVSEGFLRKLRSQDAGPTYTKMGARVMYLTSDLENYLRAGRVVTAEAAKYEAVA